MLTTKYVGLKHRPKSHTFGRVMTVIITMMIIVGMTEIMLIIIMLKTVSAKMMKVAKLRIVIIMMDHHDGWDV